MLCPLKFETIFTSLISSEYFTTNFINLTNELERSDVEIYSFKISNCVSDTFNLTTGNYSIEWKVGDCILIPAELHKLSLSTRISAELVETYVDMK